MTPERDEIVRLLDDGFAVAWDTTKVSKRDVRKVEKLGRARAAELGRIVGAADIRIEDGELVMTVEAETPAPRRARRTRAAS